MPLKLPSSLALLLRGSSGGQRKCGIAGQDLGRNSWRERATELQTGELGR